VPVALLRAVRDAHVAEDAPDRNLGASTTLVVESRLLLRPANKRLFLSFDLATLPASAVRILQGTLRLAPLRVTSGRTLRCHEVLGPWQEATVTWDNQPTVGTDHGTRPSAALPHEWEVASTAHAAFPGKRAEFRIKDDDEGALLAGVQEYPSREHPGGSGATLELLYEDEAGAALPSSVRPWLGGVGVLGASVTVQHAGSAHLRSEVLPWLARTAQLLATVVPRFACAGILASDVRVVAPVGIAGVDPLPASPPTRVLADDFLRLSEEAGSTITHASRGRMQTLRRVVHLIDVHHTRSYPRGTTGGPREASRHDVLRRGDAVLYAAGTDRFEPGDTVRWQGRAWTVVGSLGVEMAGDVPVYQEVGLRRVGVITLAEVRGEVVGRPH
jgi:hypothetical protein